MTDPVKLTVPSLYILVFESPQRFSEIKKELADVGWAGEAVKEFPTNGTGRIYAAIVVTGDGAATHICRLVRRQTAGLNLRSVGISELEELSSKDAAHLRSVILAATQKRRAGSSIQSVGRLTSAENKVAFQSINESAPALSDILRKKGRADDRILAQLTAHEREIISLERDSVGVALEIAFGERDALVVDGAARRHESFFSMLATPALTEDEVILFEKDRFPGLERLRGANPKVTEFEHNGSVLRVIHANRRA